nr:ribonuclease H-like domain, reverse transcriptase, RNA-dependent DNA polymerase [Tanacetum cinerariifolium]
MDDLKLKFEKFQTSSKNLTELLASQTNEKTSLGYNLKVFTQAMSDCDNYFSSESNCKSWPPGSLYDRFQPSGRYHAVPPPYIGTFMSPKPNLVFNTAPTAVETGHLAFNPFETSIPAATLKPTSLKFDSSGKRRNLKACFVCKSMDYLIKDCDYHAKKMPQPTSRNYTHRGNHKQYVSFTHTNPQKHMVPPAVLTQTKPMRIEQYFLMTDYSLWEVILNGDSHGPTRVVDGVLQLVAPTTAEQKLARKNELEARESNFKSWPPGSLYDRFQPSGRVTGAKAPVVSAAQELSGGYVAFGGNPKGGKISSKRKIKTEKAREEIDQQYVLFPVWSSGFTNPQNNDGDAAFDGKEHDFDAKKPKFEVNVSPSIFIVGQVSPNSTNIFSAAGHSNVAASPTYGRSSFIDASQLHDDPDMPELEDIIYSDDDDDVGAEADFNNLETSIPKEPNRVHQALKDLSWIEAMLEELLQFKMQKVWILVDLPHGKRAIGHTQEEEIDYEEVFAPVARIEAIGLFLAYASFMDFMVYQMDVKSAFLYGTIEEEVYVYQPPGFKDLEHPDKVYKVVKALYGLHQAPRAWYETLENYLLQNGFQRGLQVKQKKDGIFISQDKYVAKIVRMFGLNKGKSANTPIDTEKPLLKDLNGEDVDVHTYRSMIGSLMYLTLSRPDIIIAICACVCFQVTPKASHLHAVKKIFRYLKGKPHLGLWYPKCSPFDLVAFSDSDYAGAILDRKSTTRGCQSLGCRLISWQCKKQTVVATSSTEAEYAAAASCCA